jgi:hypothetical protein
VAALGLVLGACGQDPAGGFFIEKLTFATAQGDIEAGPTRMNLSLFPDWGERMARVVELRPDFRLEDDERIATRVLSPGFELVETESSCSGTLVVAIAGARIAFDEHTLFDDQDGSRISCSDFVTDVQTFVALGQEPQFTASRRDSATPQDPRAPVFLADAIQLDDEDGDGDARPRIEMNVDADNLAMCGEMTFPPAGCAGALRVLGTVVPVSGDRTDVHRADPEPRLEVRFDGVVERVDYDARELRLNTGAVVKIVDGSQIQWGSAPPTELVTSLEDADAGVRVGRTVEAHGTAAVMSTDPLVLWVTEVELEIEHDLAPDDFEAVVEIEGAVTDADLTDSYVELPFDTRLRVTEASTVEGDFSTVPAVGSAMFSGEHVRARARVVVEEFQKPVLVTRADRVTFALDSFE